MYFNFTPLEGGIGLRAWRKKNPQRNVHQLSFSRDQLHVDIKKSLTLIFLLFFLFFGKNAFGQCNIAYVSGSNINLSLDATGFATLNSSVFEPFVSSSSPSCHPDGGGNLNVWQDASAMMAFSPTTYNCTDLVIPTTVQVWVTLDSGPGTQSAAISFIVTIVDDYTPDITSCPNDVSVNLASPNCSVAVGGIGLTVDENCGTPTITYDITGTTTTSGVGDASGTSFFPGISTVDYEVTDDEGNMSTCSFDVNVSFPAPINFNSEPADIMVTTDPGECDAIVTWTAPTRIDGFPSCVLTPAISVSPGGTSSGQAFDLGTTTVTYSYNDGLNSVSHSFTITVTDGEAPVVNIADISVNAPLGTCEADVNLDFTSSVSDNSENCTPPGTLDVSWTITNAPGTPSGNTFIINETLPVGSYTVSVDVTDDANLTTNETFTIDVLDTELPIAMGMDITVELDANGDVTVNASQLDNGSSDNCSIVEYQMDNLATAVNFQESLDFDCTTPSPVMVNLRVLDASGNLSAVIGPFNITIEDNMGPNAQCQTITRTGDLFNSGPFTVEGIDLDDGSTDNCTNLMAANFTIAVDIAGNGFQDDVFAPTFDFSCPNNGTFAAIMKVTDDSGNETECPTSIIIDDTVDPNAMASGGTFTLDDVSGTVTVFADPINPNNIDNGSSDACDGTDLLFEIALDDGTGNPGTFTSSLSFDCTDAESDYDVFLRVTDSSGNTDIAGPVTITIDDADLVAGVIASPLIKNYDANGDVVVSASEIYDPAQTMNICGTISIGISTNPGGPFTSSITFNCNNATPDVWLQVNDGNGNIVVDGPVTISVVDNTPPVALCNNFNTSFSTNIVTITTAMIDAGSFDVCGSIASLEIARDDDNDNAPDGAFAASIEYDCSEAGAHTIILRATDANGLSSSCSSTINLQEITPPVIIVHDITVECTEDTDPNNINVTFPIMTTSESSLSETFSFFGAANGVINVSTPIQSISDLNITIQISHDELNDVSATLTAPSGNSISLFDLAGTGCTDSDIDVIFDDESGNSYASFTAFCSGGTPGITGTFIPQNLLSFFDGEDPNGAWTVTVADNDIFPFNSGTLDFVALEFTGTPPANNPLASATDNCSLMSFEYSDVEQTGANCSTPSEIIRTWTATDNAGNVSTAIQTITLVDLTAPTFTVPADQDLECPDANTSTVTDEFDACDPDVTDGGIREAFFGDANRVNGNEEYHAYLNFTNHAGIANGYNFGVGGLIDYTSNVGNGSISNSAPTSMTLNGAESGNCPSPRSGGSFDETVFEIGSIPANGFIRFDWTYTSFDNSGFAGHDPFGYDLGSGFVQITDGVAGTDDGPANQSGRMTIAVNAGQTLELIQQSIDQQCGSAITTISSFAYVAIGEAPDYLTCVDEFDIGRIWRLVDDCNNAADPQLQIIRVRDNTAPVINFPNSLTVETVTDFCVANVDLNLVNYITEACNLNISNDALISYGIGDGAGDASGFYAPGNYDIEFTVSDNCNGSTTFDIDLEVVDNQDPVAICHQNIIVSLDNTGMASLNAASVNNNSFDNCGIIGMSLSQTSFDINDVGQVAVTLTVEDNAGNTNSCTTDVTVNGGVVFDAGEESDISGATVFVPVTIDFFTDITSFEFDLDLIDGNVGNIVGITNVNPSLGVGFQSNITSTTNAFISWIHIDNNPGLSLASGTEIFQIEVLLTGNVNDSSPIVISNDEVGQLTGVGNNSAIVTSIGLAGSVTILDLANTFTLDGNLYTESSAAILNGVIDRTGTGTESDTDGDDAYSFSVPSGSNTTITPSKSVAWNNGDITTNDVSVLHAHVAGVTPLTSSYKILSGDINADNGVTTFDVSLLHQIAVGFITDVPGNTPWRFVLADPVLPNPPFSANLDGFININPVTSDVTTDFIGVRVGDVNCSVDPSQLLGVDDRDNNKLKFQTEEIEFRAGDEVVVTINSKDFTEMSSYQMSMTFDTEFLEFESTELGDLINLFDDNFNPLKKDEGLLAMNWYNLTPVDLPDQVNLFTLNFTAIQDGTLSEVLSISEDYISIEVVKADGDLWGAEFTFESFTNTNTGELFGFELHQNVPNPFAESTVISFNLPKQEEAVLTITDLSGRVVKVYNQTFERGLNQITINKKDLSVSGVLFYSLETADRIATRKMVIID